MTLRLTSDERAALVAPGAWATAREIAQQPELWTAAAASSAQRCEATRAFLAPVLNEPAARVVITGAGSSAFAGAVLAPSLSRSLRCRVDAVATTDVVSTPRETFAQDVPTVLVSLARSGDSPESVAATELADQCLTDVRHLVVTCNPDGRLAQGHAGSPRSRVLLMPEGTNDRGFAMTSSFTSMLLATWLAFEAAPAGDLVDRLAAAAETVVADRAAEVATLADAGYERVVHLGSGGLAALAREAALKLLELTAGSVVSWHDSSLGFRHGPKAVLRPATLAVVYLSNDEHTRRYDEDIASELREALGDEHVVVVAGRAPASGAGRVWVLPDLADAPDVALAAPYAVVAQLLALRASLALGVTPDNPFPAGEVNRVVQGVRIHPLTARWRSTNGVGDT